MHRMNSPSYPRFGISTSQQPGSWNWKTAERKAVLGSWSSYRLLGPTTLAQLDSMAPTPELDLLPRADTTQASSASSSNMGAIIGGTVAGLLVGILLAVVIVPRYRRRRLHEHQRLNLDPPWQGESRSVLRTSLSSAFTVSSGDRKSYEPVKLATAPRGHQHTDSNSSSSSTAPLLGSTMGGSESSRPHATVAFEHYRHSSQIISSLPSLPYSSTSYVPIKPSKEDEEDGNDDEVLRVGGYTHLQAPTPTRATTSAPIRDASPTRDTTPRPISLQFPSPPRTFPITPPSERSPPTFLPPVEYSWGQSREPVSLSVRDSANPNTPLSPHWTTASTTPRTAEWKDQDPTPMHTPRFSSRSATPTTPTPRHPPTPPITPTAFKIDHSTAFNSPPPPLAVPAAAPVASPPPGPPPRFPLPVLPPLATGEAIQTPASSLNFTYFSPSSESIDSASLYSQVTPTEDGSPAQLGSGLGSFSRKKSSRSRRSATANSTMSSNLRTSSYPPPFDIPFHSIDPLSSLTERVRELERGRHGDHRLSAGTVRAERSVSVERIDTVTIGNLLKGRSKALVVDLHHGEDDEQSSPVSAIERMGSIRGVP